METQEPHIDAKQKNPLFTVTTFSEYFALVLFILMPFIGGYIGYTFAPEKMGQVESTTNYERDGVIGSQEVVENEVEKPTAVISDDLAKYLDVTHFANYKGVSRYMDYLAYIPPDEKVLKVVHLETNKVVSEISAGNLTFLELEYDRHYTEMLPDDSGKAVFIDMADACECELNNEAVVVSTNKGFKVFPLPSVVEFEWLVGDDLKYRYKRIIPDPEKCAGVDGICVGVKVVDEWVNGQINVSDTNALEKWDGRPFTKS